MLFCCMVLKICFRFSSLATYFKSQPGAGSADASAGSRPSSPKLCTSESRCHSSVPAVTVPRTRSWTRWFVEPGNLIITKLSLLVSIIIILDQNKKKVNIYSYTGHHDWKLLWTRELRVRLELSYQQVGRDLNNFLTSSSIPMYSPILRSIHGRIAFMFILFNNLLFACPPSGWKSPAKYGFLLAFYPSS